MARKRRLPGSAGASRDGHAFHEAWTARKAMQLLLPQENGLVGIAVEGLSKEDESRASAPAVEIADLAMYYGGGANFTSASRVEIVQFKYSPVLADDEFRASHAKKTIMKFAEAYADYKRNYGAQSVKDKLFFELITNRPIHPDLLKAIEAIASGGSLSGNAKKQADQFKTAAKISGEALREFASKCRITGLAGTLGATKADLKRMVVDWSATTDAVAGARLGNIREMVQKKAGYQEEHQKVIRQVDILAALELSEVEDLLPCPSSLVDVGEVVEREQLTQAISLIPSLSKPLLVHAEGGVGKTVFLESMASKLAESNEVVFFDCFGGGAYRSPKDGRHLANRGLVHIANTLACRGLCDPILPESDNSERLFGTFRKRLEQSVKTIATVSPDRELIIFIDAADNAAEYANEREQQAFPAQLVESFERSGAVPGVKIVLSSRTHRISTTLGDLSYQDFALSMFTTEETRIYLQDRLPEVTDTNVLVAQSKSVGNARILKHLVTSDRILLDSTDANTAIALDDLLQESINSAFKEAISRGYTMDKIKAFLAGLSVLPPPVPLEEYAEAHSMDVGAIESFAVELAPLLERTEHGMTFLDEPTETFVREKYGAKKQLLKRVAKNLLDRQEHSAYAARALPRLLQKLNDHKKLFDLAFDERFPESISSEVGRRRIRDSRLRAAIAQSVSDKDWNKLVPLLVELSSVAASEQRGADFIMDNPDLVVNSQDVEALRRLFETRTPWPGTRHARLTIANILSGAQDDAARHLKNSVAWINHYFQASESERHQMNFEKIDAAAVALYWIVKNQPKRAVNFVQIWYEWYGFEVLKHVFELLQHAVLRGSAPLHSVDRFIDILKTDIDCLAGVLCFVELNDSKRRGLLNKLFKACKRNPKLQINERDIEDDTWKLQDGLRRCSVLAASMGMHKEALMVSLHVPHERPKLWAYVDDWSDRNTFPFIFRLAMLSAVKGTSICELDLFPEDLLEFSKRLPKSLSFDEAKAKVIARINRKLKKELNIQGSKERIQTDLRSKATHFLDYRVSPLMQLTKALSALLAAPLRQADKPYEALLGVWKDSRNREERQYYGQLNLFFEKLGKRAAFFMLWARDDLKASSVRMLIKCLDESGNSDPSTWIRLIEIISRNQRFNSISMNIAAKARTLIEQESDVENRSSLYASLARAILPVSSPEADAYFRCGLEQFDALGSGDYRFTSELFGFASSVKGAELSEKDFHVLSNICELNIPEEETKFPWGLYGEAMARVSGTRGLAKIARWHDREKITLDYTLMPYLTALLRDNKISPECALSLNRLARPIDLWDSSTRDFLEAVHLQSPSDKQLVAELIRQCEENETGVFSSAIAAGLCEISRKILGKSHPKTKYLFAKHSHTKATHDDLNYQDSNESGISGQFGIFQDENRLSDVQLKALALETDPLDEASIANAVTARSKTGFFREEEKIFFDKLRSRVKVSDRIAYVKAIAHVSSLDIYAKLTELATCKSKWAENSVAVRDGYKYLAKPVLQMHAKELLSFGQLPEDKIEDLSDLTGVSVPDLVLDLIRYFVVLGSPIPASAWLGFAKNICQKADDGVGQKALSRLLNSSAATLTSTVTDGDWYQGMYPKNNAVTVSAGLVWQMLGSPKATDRWLAAHSVCTFARQGCWEVIDALVKKSTVQNSVAFQAPEFNFYYLHARLWLLIALARIAVDSPKEIAKHKKVLMSIVADSKSPHVVMRHFAALALLTCHDAKALHLSSLERAQIETINKSKFTSFDRDQNSSWNAYGDFPDIDRNSRFGFRLDHDFIKSEIYGLARAFVTKSDEVSDAVSKEAHKLDSDVDNMYERDGREIRPIWQNYGLLSDISHGYGHYLGWHALHLAAGQLLKTKTTIDDSKSWGGEDRWPEWLSRQFLTRSDGHWLSDGMDPQPLDTRVNLMQKGEKGSVLTGKKEKLLELVGIDSGKIGENLVVNGRWKSPDGVDVRIGSVLVRPGNAKLLAEELIQEEPIWAWTKTCHYEGEEYHEATNVECEPWIFAPSKEGRQLDQYDPLSVIGVQQRPHFSEEITSQFSLSADDTFNRVWRLPRRKIVAKAAAWGYSDKDGRADTSGVRLLCRTDFLQKILEMNRADLIVLLHLEKYGRRSYEDTSDKFIHTVAVLRIKKSLKFEYFKGVIGKIHRPRMGPSPRPPKPRRSR